MTRSDNLDYVDGKPLMRTIDRRELLLEILPVAARARGMTIAAHQRFETLPTGPARKFKERHSRIVAKVLSAPVRSNPLIRPCGRCQVQGASA